MLFGRAIFGTLFRKAIGSPYAKKRGGGKINTCLLQPIIAVG
jgi:hypothetical protein